MQTEKRKFKRQAATQKRRPKKHAQDQRTKKELTNEIVEILQRSYKNHDEILLRLWLSSKSKRKLIEYLHKVHMPF